MVEDLRVAARTMARNKGWAAAVVVSLALGIGANTALFSAANGLLLKKLPVEDPDALVRFRHAGRNQMRTDVLLYGFTRTDAQGRSIEPTFSYPMYRQLVEANRMLSDLFACAPLRSVNVIVGGRAEIASAFFSSGNYYRVLGASARAGRVIAPDDDRPTAAPVAMISHRYWMSRFGGSPDAVGATARVNNALVTIVGVLEPGFTGVERAMGDAPDVSLPLALEPLVNLQPSPLQRSLLAAPNFWWLHVMGRMKPDLTLGQVQANFGGVFARAARAQFESFLAALPAEERSRDYLQGHTEVPEVLVDSGSRGIYDPEPDALRSLRLLGAVVALVLFMVCANVANLLLFRNTMRRREQFTRLALGATRARLCRHVLAESVLLACAGGALGIALAHWGQQFLPLAIGRTAPLDWHVLGFVAALSATTGVLAGSAPAVRAIGTAPAAALKEGTGIVGSPRSRLGRSLVVAQVTASFVVLVCAGLLVQTVENLRQVDVGFNAQDLVLFSVSPALNRYERAQTNALYERIAERVRSIAGVRTVAWSNPSLMSGRRFRTAFFIQGRPHARDAQNSISQVVVSTSFFETMGIRLLAGRSFTPHDTDTAARVAVINESAARAHFPATSPLERRFGPSFEDSGALEIVGIVKDAKYNTVREPAVATVYLPSLQHPPGSATFEVRIAGNPRAVMAVVRDAVRQVDPSLPLVRMTTQLEEIEARFLHERVVARTYAAFGGLALLVAAVGLFGLMSYSVARRTSEVGLRMALGAERDDILRLVMRESLTLAAAGVAAGLAAALAAGRVISNVLFGIAPTDVKTVADAAAIMLAISAFAGYLPARRASRVDPIAALRYE